MRSIRLALITAIVLFCLLLTPSGQTRPKTTFKPSTFKLDFNAMLKPMDDLIVQQRCTVYRIQRWLEGRGSPYAPYASLIETNARRTGINPFLCVAVGEAESNSGAANGGSLNPWGMLGCGFSSWEESITRWFDNCLSHWGQAQTGYDLQMTGNPYCATHVTQYAENVTGLSETIASVQPPLYLCIPPSFWRELASTFSEIFHR